MKKKKRFKFKLPKFPLSLRFLSTVRNSTFSQLRGDVFPTFSCNPQQNIISKSWLMGWEEEKKKATTNNTMITAILSLSAIFIYPVMSPKQRGEEVGGCRLAVSSAVCSNLTTCSLYQTQAWAIKGLIVKVGFNKTGRFSLGGGEKQLDWLKTTEGAEEDWSRGRQPLDEGRAAAAERNVYRAFYTKVSLYLCSTCQIWSQPLSTLLAALAGVLRGDSQAPQHLCCTPPNRIYTWLEPYFLTVAVWSLHTAELAWKCENNQRKTQSIFIPGKAATSCTV